MEDRNLWVDYTKAIGIILVIYGHIARGLHDADIKFPQGVFEMVDSVVYSFHMPLFFFLSGLFFVGSFAKRGTIKFIFSKIDTIIYPFIVWSILQGLIESFLSSYTNGHLSYQQVFSLLWSPRAQFWFLYALFAIFLVATAIFSIASKKAAGIVFLVSVFIYLYPSVLPTGFIFEFISLYFVYFTFGIIFTMYVRDEYISNSWLLLLLSFSFLIGQYIFHDTFGLVFTDFGFATLALALVSILFTVSFSAWLSRIKPSKLILYIGSTSMVIYLMHILAGSGTRIILSKGFGVESLWLHLLVGCVVALFAPLLALFIINKLKIKYLFSAPVSELLVSISNKIFKRKIL